LHRCRRSNGFGPEPLGWSDIDAWARLTGSLPRPGEIGALLRLDRVWLDVEHRKAEQRAKARQNER